MPDETQFNPPLAGIQNGATLTPEGQEFHDQAAAASASRPGQRPLDFTRAEVMRHAAVGGSFRGAYLAGLDLRGLDLRGPAHPITGERTGLDFEGADLSRSKLDGVVLDKANLRSAKLDQASAAPFNGTNASFRGVWLTKASLVAFNGLDGDFASANLDGSNIQGATLDPSKLEGASLHRAYRHEHGLQFPHDRVSLLIREPARFEFERTMGVADIQAREAAGRAIIDKLLDQSKANAMAVLAQTTPVARVERKTIETRFDAAGNVLGERTSAA